MYEIIFDDLTISNKILNIKIKHRDFDINAHEAVLSVFLNVNIMACRFHLRQSW